MDLLPYRRWRRPPFLYTRDQITNLLDATDGLAPPLHAATCRTFFGLLAVTGMRVGEAINLDRSDINPDAGTVLIRDAKFGKHRQLPVHPSTIAALEHYASTRDQLCLDPTGTSWFVSVRGARLTYPSVRTSFARLLSIAGITAPADRTAPTIHSLRHSFAVATLRDWYRDQDDVTARLPVLSAYLGHAHPASTYWYLSAAPDLLAQAAHRLEASTQDRP